MYMISWFIEMPMGQMPILEVDGKIVHQSMAMARYLGKVVKLNGHNDWEDLMIDVAADTINDFRMSKLIEIIYKKNICI